jgi:hypothetical protein
MSELSPEELTPIDREILNYINQFESISKIDIMESFQKYENIEYLIKLLERCKHKRTPMGNSTYLNQYGESYIAKVEQSLDDYSITNFGKRALQNYLHKERQERKLLWLTNAKIPIVISIITYLILRVLEAVLRLIVSVE